jgi:hypothetical protein
MCSGASTLTLLFSTTNRPRTGMTTTIAATTAAKAKNGHTPLAIAARPINSITSPSARLSRVYGGEG